MYDGIFRVSINEILSGKRLTIEEYKQAAEENLQHTIRASSFTLKDRIDFYKKKWLKEHVALMVFLGIIVIAVLVIGLVLREGQIVYVAILLLVCFHGYRYNAMMTYVEKNAYNCSCKR